MKVSIPLFGGARRALFVLFAMVVGLPAAAFPLPPAGTPLLLDPQLQACFDEHVQANGWTGSEQVTALVCPDRDIRDLGGLEVFTGLRELDLARNRLEFAWPIAQLHQLEVLDLSHNRLFDIFPLHSLAALRELDLSGNRPADSSAPGVSLDSVNPVIVNNPGLTHLGVAGMPIAFLDQLAVFDPYLNRAENLVVLDVSQTGIEDTFALVQAPNLRELRAAGNRLRLITIDDPHNRLEVLDLADNALDDIYPLQFLQALRRLDLSGNARLAAGEVQATVLNNPGLTHLYLADIPLEGLHWLPAGMPGHFDLVELDISRTGIYPQIESLVQYPNLRLLAAAGNGLQGTWTHGSLTGIEELDLSDNQLSSVDALSFLDQLTRLNLSGNAQLPAGAVADLVQSSPGLTHVGVSGIAFGDLSWLPAPGPHGEFNLRQLEISAIGKLHDLGPVGQYPELRVLKAAGNRLQALWGGGGLTRLEVIDVSDNRLSSLYEVLPNQGLEQLILSGNVGLPQGDIQAVVQNNPGLTHLGLAKIELQDFTWLPAPGPQGEYDLLELDISETGERFDLAVAGQYRNLRVLRAAGNRLLTAFPVDQLTDLEVLDLSDNELWDIVALAPLRKLRELNLSGNRNADISSPAIDLVYLNQVLENNPGITHLGVAGVAIGDLDQLAPFAPFNYTPSPLQELDISDTGVDFIDAVSRAPSLRVLRAAGNRIEFVFTLQQLSRLEVLDLGDNRLAELGWLQGVSGLRELNLSGNARLPDGEVQNVVFANPGLTRLGLGGIALPSLAWLPGMSPGAWDLVELDISDTGRYHDLVPLASYRNLRVLEAAGNGLEFAWGLEQMPGLEVLDLGDNHLREVSALYVHNDLRRLDLSGNGALSPIDVQNIVHANPGLTHLGVADIAFGGTAWLPVPGPLGEWDLRELDISNTLSYPVLAGIARYAGLRVLRAAGNALEYPVEIDQLHRLEILDLGDNRLVDGGGLPALGDLRRLNLSGNGSLPLGEVQALVQANPWLTHVGVAGIAMTDLQWLPSAGPQGEFNLQELDVSHTGLQDLGVLDRYPGLRVLRAAGNALQSIFFGQRMGIEVLDLSDNQLWDAFALSDLDQLRELYLSGNQPAEPFVPGIDLATVNQAIEDNPNLTRLGIGGVAIGDLGQLALFGPGNPVGLNLVELDISDAGLGDVYRIAELPALRVLNVSGNEIFDSYLFAGLQQLTDLDLSDNAFEQVLPLGDLVNLARLDLRGNDTIQCAELDQLEFRLGAAVLIRPDTCIVGMPPTINIAWPAPGAQFYATDAISFLAGASDLEDGILNGQIQWTSDLAGPIGSGAEFELALPAGDHRVTASVVDSDGNAAAHSVEILVLPNTAPTLTIDSVQDGAVFMEGEIVSLVATAFDAEEGDLGPAVQWQSSLAGTLGGGAAIQLPLGIGEHLISASVSDQAGATAAQTVSLRINGLPQLDLLAPLDGSVVPQDQPVFFAAAAYDHEDGDVAGQVQWHSDLDGFLGGGAQLSLVLASVGQHTITASLSDSDGATVTQIARLTVDSLPSIELLSPADGSLFMLTEPVVLGATASDLEDGNLGAAVTWTSNLDGYLGSGGKLSIDSLSLGTHTISASVSDSAAGAVSATMQLVIDQIDLQVTVSGGGKWQQATLTWSGSRTDVDIYKNDRLRRSGGPSGTSSFRFKNQASFKVCETGTAYCSPEIVVQAN